MFSLSIRRWYPLAILPFPLPAPSFLKTASEKRLLNFAIEYYILRMEEREKEEHVKRQHKKYTVLLQEHGKVLQEYSELEQQVEELDRERTALKQQL